MIQMVHLAIVNLDGLTIALVEAPFALMRGGASPVALVRFTSYRREDGFSSGIRGARGTGDVSPRVAKW
jgi:hypothetical protein